MKKIILACIMLSTISLKSQALYDVSNVNTIDITFTQANWDQILDTYYADGNDERLLATVVINGESFDSVGVRYRGGSTFNPNNAKNPMNIKLDEHINQQYGGYSVLKLNNGDKDPTFVREVLGYEIARKYMFAPQSNYVNITVNGTLLGLYNNVESINSDFQERYMYANRDATRIKADPAQVQSGGASLEYLGPNEVDYFDFYELDSDTGWSDLITLTNIVDNAPILVEDYLDIDRAIWMMAYNNVLVNLDSYTGPFKDNYYLIRAKNDNMIPVLWDLNESMGSFGLINQGSPGGNLAQLDLLLRENDSSWPLLKLIFDDPTYKRMYVAHCKTIFDENIANDSYYERAVNLQNIFGSSLQTDANAIYSYAEAQNNLTSTVNTGGPGSGFIGLTELFDARKTYLSATSEFQATAPTISTIVYEESVPANTELTVSAEITNSNSVIFGYRLNSGDRFTKIAMLDDGLNEDLTAGDNIFTVTIAVEATDIQFYIYAENDDAGMFSPRRAEHEFYSVSTTNDIVLNEIQARNDFTQPDQNGEFDDWIELYNNSTSTIDLSNYYLSDKGSNLTRWQFPAGTTIDADDYLIIWADADTLQGGLHANFKLSGGGESVYFTDGTTILDKIKYVYFWTDTTYGRFPNGTGTLKLMSATFNAFNGLEDTTTIAIINREKETAFDVYPNPSQEIVYIDWESDEDYEIMIYDIMGHEMYRGKDKQVFTGQWSAGLYLVNVNGTSKKLIIK